MSTETSVPSFLPMRINVQNAPLVRSSTIWGDESQRFTHGEAEQYACLTAARLDKYVVCVDEPQLGGRYQANLATLPEEIEIEQLLQLEAHAKKLREGTHSPRDLGRLVIRSFVLHQWWLRENDSGRLEYASISNRTLQDQAYIMYRLSSAIALLSGVLPTDKDGVGPEKKMAEAAAIGTIASDWVRCTFYSSGRYQSEVIYETMQHINHGMKTNPASLALSG